MKKADRFAAKLALEHASSLIDRAIEIVSAPPYQVHVDEPRFASLTLDAETAILQWPRREGDYPGLSVYRVEFPFALLVMSSRALHAWRRRGGGHLPAEAE